MRPLNDEDLINLSVKFSISMVCLITLTLLFILTFLKTSEAELAEIKLKTSDCEKIFRVQIELCDEIDDFFIRYRAFDSKEDVNTEFLMRSIVDRKMEINKKIEQMPSKDVKIHASMLEKMDEFLRVRDSISYVKKEESRVKEDLFLCNGDYVKLNKQKRNSKFLQ